MHATFLSYTNSILGQGQENCGRKNSVCLVALGHCSKIARRSPKPLILCMDAFPSRERKTKRKTRSPLQNLRPRRVVQSVETTTTTTADMSRDSSRADTTGDWSNQRAKEDINMMDSVAVDVTAKIA